jgi:hypothetical protein
VSPARKPAEPEPEAEQQSEAEAKAEPKHAKRGDPWDEPCPVCGLLGCRRHA